MQLGLKNRLRLISLLPIIILFALSSYFVYNSFINYKMAQQLQEKLNQNKLLNEVVGNVARERGMSSMFLGNKTENILKSLNEQRKIVDEKTEKYLNYIENNELLHKHTSEGGNAACLTCANMQ
ncbi:MAG TPA: nitrate- and nitrite sensing domain-containing protein, partial [Sulfurimonas sp.]